VQKFSGLSLIELLISLLILSLVLLGFDAMQWSALHDARESYFFSIAEGQIYSVIERLHAHPRALDLPQQRVLWNRDNQELLPAGKGYISGSYPSYQITLFWGEKTNKQVCPQINSGILNCLNAAIEI
jgi:hypothetical protein